MEDGYRLDYWRDRARSIRPVYEHDPEGAHSDEDELLAEFVRGVADGLIADPQAAAQMLIDELLSHDRVRWYS